MSSDESDGEAMVDESFQPQYRVLTPRWRSEALTNLLHAIDSVHLTLRRMDAARQRGKWPRLRLYDSKSPTLSSRQRHVTGLPQNAYNAEFLATPSIAGDLERSVNPKAPVDLSFDPDIWRYVVYIQVQRSYDNRFPTQNVEATFVRVLVSGSCRLSRSRAEIYKSARQCTKGV
jgi:hypothetical protein